MQYTAMQYYLLISPKWGFSELIYINMLFDDLANKGTRLIKNILYVSGVTFYFEGPMQKKLSSLSSGNKESFLSFSNLTKILLTQQCNGNINMKLKKYTIKRQRIIT